VSKAFRLGVFLVATLGIFAAGIFFIGSSQFLFRSTFGVRAEFPNVTGLTQGADVRVGGTRQGTVNHVALPKRPDGKVIVFLDLDRGTHNVVKTDSVAAIRSEGLLGDKYVEVSFGSNDAEKLKGGETIASEPPVDMSDLMKTAGQVLDSSKETMDNLAAISTKVNRGEGTIGALINDKKIYQQASAATAQAAAGAAAFKDDMDAMKHNFLLRGFFKKRGYDDASELTKNEIAGLPKGPAMKKFVYLGDQMFDKESAKFKKEKDLSEAGSFLESTKFGLVVVVGYTGQRGDSEKNRELAQARAMVVRGYLAKNFKLDDTRIKTLGMGETGSADDRGRVEIVVFPGQGKVNP
jgi:phospholipid/cholesterol/gamma-HCH transport system substrate-binding protein